MTDPAGGPGFTRVASGAAKAVFRAFRLERARREANRSTLLNANLLRPQFEEAIGVLAQDADGAGKAIKDRAKALFSEQPPEFADGVALAWIRTEKAQERLIELATNLVGGRDADLTAADIEFYDSFGPGDGDLPAAEIIDLALEFMLASAYRHLEPAARVVLSRLEPRIAQVDERLEEMAKASAFAASPLAVDAQDAAIQAEVRRLRQTIGIEDALRATQALKLAERILEGDLAGAGAEVRAFGLSWVVRLANGHAPDEEIGRLLDAARGIDQSDYVKAAQAMFVGLRDWPKGLAVLKPFDTPVLRGAAVRLRHRTGSTVELLEWFGSTGWADEDLDPAGKLILVQARLLGERWQEAADSARRLDDVDFDAEPELFHLAGVSRLALSLPADMRRVLLAGLPVNSGSVPLADDPVSVSDRREAATLFEQAAVSALARGGIEASRMWTVMALWLRLRDQGSADDARAGLAKGLTDPERALSLIPLALDFEVPVDRAAAERTIQTRLALEPSGSVETARARVALILSEPDPEEKAAALQRYEDELRQHLDPGVLMYFRAVALAEAEKFEEARALIRVAAEQGLSSESLERLEEALSAEGGFHEPPARPDLDPATATTPALAVEVERLARLGVTDRYLQLARALVARTRSIEDAEQLVIRLLEHGRNEDVASILVTEAADLVASSAVLISARAWSAYWNGDLAAAETDLAVASSMRDHPAERALKVNLLISSGRWSDLAGFVEEEWTKAADRSPAELIGLARLAAAIGSSRRDSLTDMAAAAASDDPNILIGSYMLAVQSGRDEEPHVANWLNDAVRLSGNDGPVRQTSLAEMVEGAPERRKRLEALSEQFRRGDLPLFVASEATRRSLVDAHLATLVRNSSLADPGGKILLPVFSGARLAQPLATYRTITLDVGAIFDLSYLDLLGMVLEAFDEVRLPHSVLAWLFGEKQKLPFHQPSRTVAAHRLRRWIAEGAVSVADDADPPAERIDTVGRTLARLATAAEKARAEGAGRAFVIHGFPVSRPGSLSGEPADLGELTNVFASSIAAVEPASGLLQRRQLERARAHLKLAEQPWPEEPQLDPSDIVFLDRLALDHLGAAGALEAVVRAFSDVRISSDAVAEADALIAHEAMAAQVEGQVERIRAVLADGLSSGKVRLAPAAARDEDVASHPSGAALLLAGQVEAIVSDDRFINVNPQMSGSHGEAPIWTTIDVLRTLRERELLDEDRHHEALAALRAAGVCFVPLDAGELGSLLAVARTDAAGAMIETAELRALRENVRLIQARGVLRLPQEADWMKGLADAILSGIRFQWSGEVPEAEARARSSWLLALVDMRNWAASVDGPTVETLASFGMAGVLSRLLISSREEWPAEYTRWLGEQVEQLSLDAPREHDRLLSHLRTFVRDSASQGVEGIEDPDEARRLGAGVALNMMPPFMQLKVGADLDVHDAFDLSIEGQVLSGGGRASFDRSKFHDVVRETLADPASEPVIIDESGEEWRASQPEPDRSRVRLTRVDGVFTQGDFFAVDPDGERRLAGLERAIAASGLPEASAEPWRTRLKAAPLPSDRTRYLEQDLAATPRSVARALERQTGQNSVLLSLLVPTDRRYYERLAGEGAASNLKDYADRIAVPLIRERLNRDAPDIALATLMNGHGFFAEGLKDADDAAAVARWAAEHGDPLCLVMVLEAYLGTAATDVALAEALLPVARKLHGLMTSDPHALDLLSAIALLTDGEVSHSGVLADWPPFRRRAAVLAHVALVYRAAAVNLSGEDFPRWAAATRGHSFLLQTIIDLRTEPRWDGELIDGSQLEQEIIGRVTGAASAAAIAEGELHDLLLGEEEGSFRSLAKISYCWPGPLEGGLPSTPIPLPEEAEKALDAGLADERATLKGLMPLLNTWRMGTVGPERVAALVGLLERSNYLVEGVDRKLMLEGVLYGFAGLAAAARSPELASATRIAARRSRGASATGAELVSEMRIALTAAAAHEELGEWSTYAGEWAEELALAATGDESADVLMRELDELYALEPRLRIGCGRATALLQLASRR